MAISLAGTLQRALSQLERERARLDGQIAALRQALKSSRRNGARPAGFQRARRSRGRMSAAARKAVSTRMRAYWAKRRQESGKKARAAAR